MDIGQQVRRFTAEPVTSPVPGEPAAVEELPEVRAERAPEPVDDMAAAGGVPARVLT